MSEDHHDRINNEDDDSGFYNAGKSEESEEKEEQENIPSKSDAFKSSKHKKIHKREKGHAKKSIFFHYPKKAANKSNDNVRRQSKLKSRLKGSLKKWKRGTMRIDNCMRKRNLPVAS